jgi:hypothetical protein
MIKTSLSTGTRLPFNQMDISRKDSDPLRDSHPMVAAIISEVVALLSIYFSL